MLKKSLIGLIIVIFSGGGYFGYTSYQDYKKKERVRLWNERNEHMMTAMIEANKESRQSREEEENFYIERRKRIEAGTAKIEPVEEITIHGDKHQYTLVDGKREGAYRIWYKSGRKQSETFYKDNKKVGESLGYHDDTNNTLESKVFYENNELKGPYIRWYKDGRVANEGFYSYDVKLFWGKSWYKDGALKRKSSYDFETDSSATQKYYEGGQLESAYFRKSNKFIGIYKEWYKNGQKKQEAYYNNKGERDGWDYKWDEFGKVIKRDFYVKGYPHDPPVSMKEPSKDDN